MFHKWKSDEKWWAIGDSKSFVTTQVEKQPKGEEKKISIIIIIVVIIKSLLMEIE